MQIFDKLRPRSLKNIYSCELWIYVKIEWESSSQLDVSLQPTYLEE